MEFFRISATVSAHSFLQKRTEIRLWGYVLGALGRTFCNRFFYAIGRQPIVFLDAGDHGRSVENGDWTTMRGAYRLQEKMSNCVAPDTRVQERQPLPPVRAIVDRPLPAMQAALEALPALFFLTAMHPCNSHLIGP